MAENWEFLRQVPVFADLSPEELQHIASLALLRRYRKNMYIFMEGEPGDAIYFVKKGAIKLFQVLEDGREKILHFVREGEIFAEVLLFEGGPYPATAETLEDTEVGIIRNADMERLLSQHGEIAVKIIKVMSRRLRRAQEHIRDLALKGAYGRLASTLLQLARDYGTPREDGVTIDLNLSQQELASLIGTSRETVARILSDFKRLGAVGVERQRITILSPQKLAGWD
ncbi:MAG: family transcriptional regulator, cyclic receptor protein [Moorella sp. (in: firmicutes)]|jgi:CRP/FNR family transcriptional regulator|uniref:Crp/Fnr family transcriptional regulator n=1 Tax=unclassified Neomoorella TaxID=2676739 RepID=UPI0010FFAE56|nr:MULTISPECIES: Crp/Fnr family transcriptional regulator [unclassified Moorella (in: firmicutes)]MDK2816065.1 family transcriptional regulator, cyclic receptor protein [Moorella sp. (in: firmicutes)]MDK2895778.1 family transcriptional regulator, cyclic receptor protein [Moorella sp. (in: firmicutes)]GEA16700.1 cAMP-binding protein [Moorella sp. E308F]GEA17111.1 cAMP-binding protein [Moorella sp. E306M]